MAPNLALATHALTSDIICSKLSGDKVPTDKEVAKTARCCERTIRRHRRNYLLYGSTKAPANGGGRPATITPIMLSALCDQLADKSGMRVSDMKLFLDKSFDVETTPSSIRRALKKHGNWGKKVTENIAQERNPDLRDDFIHALSELRSDQMVIVDESGAHKGTGMQKKGWAPKGKRPRQVKRFHRGRRFQILPAYTQDGVIHFMVYEGSTDTEVFETFIETLLPYCGRWPEPRSVLIMDNASFHFSPKIDKMLEEAGVVKLLQCPYSPDVSPIEEFFGELKGYIRQVWDDHEDFIREDFGGFLEHCVTTVGARKASARGHFRRAGISIDENLD